MLGAAIDIAAGLQLLPGIAPLSTTSASSFSRFGFAVTLAVVLASFGLAWIFVQPDAIKMASGIYRFGIYIPPESGKILLEKDGKTATVQWSRCMEY